MVMQNIAIKSQMRFSQNEKDFAIVRFRIRLLIFMRLTADIWLPADNLMWFYGYVIPNTWPPYEGLLNIFGLRSNVTLFADDTSLFSVVENKNKCQ